MIETEFERDGKIYKLKTVIVKEDVFVHIYKSVSSPISWFDKLFNIKPYEYWSWDWTGYMKLKDYSTINIKK